MAKTLRPADCGAWRGTGKAGVQCCDGWWRPVRYWSVICWGALTFCACLLLLDVRALVKAQFGVAQREGAKTRQLADIHARQIEQDLRLRLDGVLDQVRATSGAVLAIATRLERDANQQAGVMLGQSQQAIVMSNARIAEATGALQTATAALAALRPKLDGVLDAASGIESDARPHLAAIGAHVDEASAVLLRRDALPAQVLGLTAAAKVTFGESAETMKAVKAAAPKLADSAVKIGDSAAGVMAAAKREADEFTKPKTFRQKVFEWLGIVPRVLRVVL